MSHVIPFTDPAACDFELVGGKGANLGVLLAGGFPVPLGFTVTTSAYADALAAAGLDGRIAGLLAQIDYDDIESTSRVSEEIAALVREVDMPASTRTEILEAYASLGAEVDVAVRSSGTAEDVADASFAGLHDTFLDVKGADCLITAITECWASMWSARAVGYRHKRSYDHSDVSIAVVVQKMVASEVSGVLFTGNPLNARSDQFVINASYGLGEAVVSSLVNPDEVIVDGSTLEIVNLRLGDKKQAIRRAADGHGTAAFDVAPEWSAKPALDEQQVAALCAIGRRVMAHYGGLPQDVEWALADGQFFVLQARPITGVEFTWDEELEDYHTAPEDPDTLWTFKYSEQFWTGGITPLFYTVRGRESHVGIENMNALAGFSDLKGHRTYRYKYGTVYYNVDVDEKFTRSALPRFARPLGAYYVPSDRVEATLAEPLEVMRYLRMLTSVNSSPWGSMHRWKRHVAEMIQSPEAVARANGLHEEQLRILSDRSLQRYTRSLQQQAIEFMDPLWVGGHIHMPVIFSLFWQLVESRCPGDNARIRQDLMSGLPETLQTQEMQQLFELACRLRGSLELRASFAVNPGPSFFEALAHGTEEERQFLADYRDFLAAHGHRGHTDRDLIFPRRADDSGIDYNAFKMYLQAQDLHSPRELERKVYERQRATYHEVHEALGGGIVGCLRQKAFRLLHEIIIDFLALRDNKRHFIDRITYAKRKAFLEVGGRCVERGYLAQVEDCFFLGERELFGLLAGTEPAPLTQAKIEARRKQFERMESRMWTPPMYLRGDTALADGPAVVPDAGAGAQGVGTSAGIVEGIARVVASQADIGSLSPGDILVCQSTDPGWTPVFNIIAGLVMETGGMLAHGACLSREHGLPAVQLVGAMQVIPDGAVLRVDGSTGSVVVLRDPSVAG